MSAAHDNAEPSVAGITRNERDRNNPLSVPKGKTIKNQKTGQNTFSQGGLVCSVVYSQAD